MPPKSIVPHRHAVDDVLDVVDYYREHAETPVAEKFSFEVDQALERLSQHPNIGSPRPALDLDIEGIKSWALKRFPRNYRNPCVRAGVCAFVGLLTGTQCTKQIFDRLITSSRNEINTLTHKLTLGLALKS